MSSNQIPAAMLQFTVVSLGSVVVGVVIGLLCSFLFKNTHIRDYPTYEIGLLFLFAYGSYALAEAVELSGIMALFFCGIVLAHYNSYNLSEASKGAAEVVFHALALVSETFVFLYMGMGLFTGRFSGWSPRFIAFAILFCLIARVGASSQGASSHCQATVPLTRFLRLHRRFSTLSLSRSQQTLPER